VEVPLFPALEAVIVAEPADTPDTTPLEFTLATAALLVDHVMVWPVMTMPWASFAVAYSDTVAPATTDAVDGVTVTLATTDGGGGGGVTVTTDVPTLPELVAVTVAAPALIPATTPVGLTVAMAWSVVDQVTAWFAITAPDASLTVATSDWETPAAIDAVSGATVTVVTTGPGAGSVKVPPALEVHTASAGKQTSNAQLRAMRFMAGDAYDMSRNSSLVGWQTRCDVPGNKMPPRHRQLLVGFAGGSAGVAEVRDSPVALRRRLSTALLW
jgi:hypothetical protein